MPKFPWLKQQKKTDPEIPARAPIPLPPYSNGEFFRGETEHIRKVKKMILATADEKARKLGIDRRAFLASSMGMMASLSALNSLSGCSDSSTSGSGGAPPTDGGFDAPAEALCDEELAKTLLNHDYFIFDMQTHHADVSADNEWSQSNPGIGSVFRILFPGAQCSEFDQGLFDDNLECLGFERYVDLIFLSSDTTMSVLSGFPAPLCADGITEGCGNLLSTEGIARSRDVVNMSAGSQRMLNHFNLAPNDNLPAQLARMEQLQGELKVVGGWKMYPAWAPTVGDINGGLSGPPGYTMDDPNVAIPVIEKGLELGVNVFCVHKGPELPGFDPVFNDAADMGRVAKMFPEAKFVIYHSGAGFRRPGDTSPSGTSGPYDPAVDNGVNNVVKSLEDAGLGQNSNLYAELGSLWLQAMLDPNTAQHVIGKLLKHFGDDNVLWGSETIWFNSPQPQIEAFKSFSISQQYQDQFGYPELTDERKRKIFGLNAAKLYGIDPEARRCEVAEGELARMKKIVDGEFGERRWALQETFGPKTYEGLMQHRRQHRNEPG